MGFKALLRKSLIGENIIPGELLEILPSGFQELDKRLIVNLNPKLHPYAEAIALKIIALLPRMKAIWLRMGQIKGKFRQPIGFKHLWGDKSTEVIVNENNVRYKFDFHKIMFAKGNIHERALLPTKIQKDEVIVDMFSGIGYFSLGIAKTKRPQKVYSIEWNPVSYKYLVENIKLNHLENIIQPIHGDCKEEVKKLSLDGVKADRIIMGLLPAPVDCISSCLHVIKDSGSIVVYEGVEPKDSTKLFDEFSKITLENGYSSKLLERRIVKNYKPHEYHVVVEIFVQKQV
jgi:tRNA wybutosine-synthesizing protein 2